MGPRCFTGKQTPSRLDSTIRNARIFELGILMVALGLILVTIVLLVTKVFSLVQQLPRKFLPRYFERPNCDRIPFTKQEV